MLAPFSRLLNPRSFSLGCRLFRVLALAVLLLFTPALTPPSAPPRSISIVPGVNANSTPSLESSLLVSVAPGAGEARMHPTRLLILEHTEAWKHLPRADRGSGQPLPVWARTLAKTLPRTTSAMLELDYLHRARNPIEPILRGQLRWVAAQVSGCRYSQAQAAADLRRAGVEEAGIQQLAGDLAELPASKRAALAFARKLTRDGSSVTDAEVKQLVSLYGEQQVVAMVLLLAYANFQDRLLLALDLPLEPNGPLSPVDVRFARVPLGVNRAGPARRRPAVRPTAPPVNLSLSAKKPGDEVACLPDRLADQRQRRSRIALPAADADAPRWGLVCRTYQPELTDAWAACIHAFSDEADQDPLFEQNVFWLITHDIRCFY